MFKNYLKIALRLFNRNRQHVLINIVGLALGFGLFIMSYVNYRFSQTFDSFHSSIDQIYRLNIEASEGGNVERFAIAPIALYDFVNMNIPEVGQNSRFLRDEINLRYNGNLTSLNMAMVDTGFFKMFDFKSISGSSDYINDRSTVILTEKAALRIFGNTDVEGETVELILGDQPRLFTVGAILFNVPKNGSILFEAAINIETYLKIQGVKGNGNWDDPVMQFLQIPDPSKVDKVFGQISRIVEENVEYKGKVLKAYPDALSTIRETSREIRPRHHWLNNGIPLKGVSVPFYMSLAILIVALINFTNTTISLAGRRLKEIGIRKVLGGSKRHQIAQLIVENFVIGLIALVAGLIMAELLLPVYSGMWSWLDLKISYTEEVSFLVFLLLFLFISTVVSILYPAYYIGKFETVQILKGSFLLKDSGIFTKSLLALQFLISVILLLTSVSFGLNARYQENENVGFIAEGVWYHYFRDSSEVQKFAAEMKKIPIVQETAASVHNIYNMNYNVKYRNHDVEISLNEMFVDAGFIDFNGLKLVEGRDFSENSATDRQESVIVNRAMVEEYLWDKPLEEVIRTYYNGDLRVIGVVENFRQDGFFNKSAPVIFRMANPENFQMLMIKSTAGPDEIQEAMGRVYKEWFPYRLFTPYSMNYEINRAMEINANVVMIFSFLGLVGLILTATGLYSLISLRISNKQSELAIRKVLGASQAHIIGKLSSVFLIMILLALSIGIPLGILVSEELLNTLFYYHAQPGFKASAIVFVIIIVLFVLSIAGKVRRALLENPVKSILSE